jgi:acyl transferase domain-containing protein
MGQALYEADGTFREAMDRLDAMASRYLGQSVLDAIYNPTHPNAPFDDLLFSHPALFMTQYALAQTLLARTPEPSFLMGTSLGEFVAAAVAQVAPVETMLFQIVKHARLFDDHDGDGAMLVVLEDVAAFQRSPFAGEELELAGVNFDRCFAVAGRRAVVQRLADTLRKDGVSHQLLPVTHAFHSSCIENMRDLFVATFGDQPTGPARYPIVSSVDGEEKVKSFGFTPEHWWNVVRRPIAFQKAFRAFRAAHPEAIYVDLSPSGTMGTFAKYNMPASQHGRIVLTLSPFRRDAENVQAAQEKISALLSEEGSP